MDIIIFLLILVSLINLFLGVFIFKKNPKSKINLFYFLMMLFAVLWTISLIVYYFHISNGSILLTVKLANFFALFITLFYGYFSYYFPFKSSQKVKITLNVFTILVLLINSAVLFYDDFLLYSGLLPREITNVFCYSIFTALFTMIVIVSSIVLLKKKRISEGIIRKQINYVLYAVLISFILGSATNLIPGFFNYYQLSWLGPIFTLINFSVVGYLIFYKSSKIV